MSGKTLREQFGQPLKSETRAFDADEHQHPMQPRWALDGPWGGKYHLVGWEPYHGTTTWRASCGLLPSDGWYVLDPSDEQRNERCKRCLRVAAARGLEETV